MEEKFNGFDDRNIEEDLKKYERKNFSEEFIIAREEFVNFNQNQDFEYFLKNKNPKLLAEWLKFKKNKKKTKKKIKSIDYEIPPFLRKKK